MIIAICENDINQMNLTKALLKKYMVSRDIEYDLFCYSSGEEIINDNRSFDLVLMDVEMDRLSGIETAAKIREKDDKVFFFFITAHSKYLDAAMDHNILRFFQKPLDENRFFRGLDKAVELIYQNTDRFYFESKKETVCVLFKDIALIEILNRKTRIITKTGEFLSTNKMDFWTSLLPDTVFASPHKSFIINFNYLSAISANDVSVTVNGNTYKISIAAKRKKEFKDAFFKYTKRLQK